MPLTLTTTFILIIATSSSLLLQANGQASDQPDVQPNNGTSENETGPALEVSCPSAMSECVNAGLQNLSDVRGHLKACCHYQIQVRCRNETCPQLPAPVKPDQCQGEDASSSCEKVMWTTSFWIVFIMMFITFLFVVFLTIGLFLFAAKLRQQINEASKTSYGNIEKFVDKTGQRKRTEVFQYPDTKEEMKEVKEEEKRKSVESQSGEKTEKTMRSESFEKKQQSKEVAKKNGEQKEDGQSQAKKSNGKSQLKKVVSLGGKEFEKSLSKQPNDSKVEGIDLSMGKNDNEKRNNKKKSKENNSKKVTVESEAKPMEKDEKKESQEKVSQLLRSEFKKQKK